MAFVAGFNTAGEFSYLRTQNAVATGISSKWQNTDRKGYQFSYLRHKTTSVVEHNAQPIFFVNYYYVFYTGSMPITERLK